MFRAKIGLPVSLLPVRLEDLIHARTVESSRLEFKKTWNDVIRDAVVPTIAAFANDYQGLNGGYVILGIEDKGGQPILPPHGLDDLDLERIQKELRGNCQKIHPPVEPLIVPEILEGKHIIVVYVPLSDARPHQAPEHGGKQPDRHYYVRIGPETKVATGAILTQLLAVSARVPFDERRRADVPLSVVSPRLLARYLIEVGSDLAADASSLDVRDVLRRLRLTGGLNGSEGPRNAALLFFTEEPEDYFPGCRIELAQFRDDAGGDIIESKTFGGPLDMQIGAVIDFLSNTFGEVVRKQTAEAQSDRFVAYPTKALREALVNAVYHRGYDGVGTPPRIGLYPDRVEITSFPGPVAGIEAKHLAPGGQAPQVPARNPRLGDMLKALRLAETWHTGVPKIHRSMSENGSPAPHFEFDADRTYFRVILPAHPGYLVLHAQREAAALWFSGERDRALAHLSEARRRVPGSGALAAQMIDYLASRGDLIGARKAFIELEQTEGAFDRHLAYLSLASAYLDAEQREDASTLLANAPPSPKPAQQIELAILHKRSGEFERAHRAFSSVADSLLADPRGLHEWAQTKIRLAERLVPKGDVQVKARQTLLRDALDLLIRVTELAGDQRVRAAWAWFDIARARDLLKEPKAAVRVAIERAISLLPGESRFLDWRDKHL